MVIIQRHGTQIPFNLIFFSCRRKNSSLEIRFSSLILKNSSIKPYFLASIFMCLILFTKVRLILFLKVIILIEANTNKKMKKPCYAITGFLKRAI